MVSLLSAPLRPSTTASASVVRLMDVLQSHGSEVTMALAEARVNLRRWTLTGMTSPLQKIPVW
jgi:hypothetical protein